MRKTEPSFIIHSKEQKKKEKRRKLGLIALAISAAVAVIAYMGSPVIWLTVQPKAWEHVRQEHPEVVEKVRSGETEFFKGIWNVDFYSANNSGVSFDIVYDKRGVMISCGYESWYLKGGDKYYSLTMKYEDTIHEMTEGEISEDGYLFFHGEMTDYLNWLTIKYSPTGSYSKAMAIDYKGPYLDPEKECTPEDFARVTKAAGNVSCHFYTYSGEKSDFVDRTIYALEKLEKSGLYFNSFTAVAQTENTKASLKRFELSRELTYDELYSGNIREIIEEHTIFVTYTADGEVIKQ